MFLLLIAFFVVSNASQCCKQEKDVESIKQSLIDGYENSFWTCSASKLGYSGTAIISRVCLLSPSTFIIEYPDLIFRNQFFSLCLKFCGNLYLCCGMSREAVFLNKIFFSPFNADYQVSNYMLIDFCIATISFTLVMILLIKWFAF